MCHWGDITNRTKVLTFKGLGMPNQLVIETTAMSRLEALPTTAIDIVSEFTC